MTRHLLSALAAGTAALAVAAVAAADPAGRTTLSETIRASGSGFASTVRGPGEPYVVRRGNAAARRGRAGRRRSIVFFGQFTDPQIADEMSPLRGEFLDPIAEPGTSSSGLGSAWRPQEAMGLHTFDRTVRNMNANRRSGVRGRGGARARLQFAITTGDLADNQQLNETRWFVSVLDGGRVDPFSGKPVGASNPCPGASDAEIARLNADVAARRYTGVQDYADWPGRPPDRYAGFWDPNQAAPVAGPYSAFPRWPGLMDRAQRPFTAQGSRVPWFISRGNHDGLTQGTLASTNPLLTSIATSCLKVFPSEEYDPGAQRGKSYGEVLGGLLEPESVARLLAGALMVPPDPDRRVIDKLQYKAQLGRGTAHGFGLVDRVQNRASAGTASYYSFVRRGVRFIAMDTVAEGGGPEGNLDDPQYRWIESELRKARHARQLVILYGHHTLGTMRNSNPDELAGACPRSGALPGCDRDPRRSTPIHLGLTGRKSLRELLWRYPNVIATVVGHTHDNRINGFFRRGRGFWEINTASHIDWPQQSRQVEVMDNRDGTLSLFTTILDQAAPLRTPPAGAAAGGFTDTDLAAISRRLSLNDPQALQPGSGGLDPRGKGTDRNAELVVRDPR